ncbi:hypothetical protein VPH35_047343 [Triticum aestivum]
MDPRVILGPSGIISRSDIRADLERHGQDPETLDLGSNMMLHFVYKYLPAPPVSPTATLPLAGTSWVPDGVDRISRLPDVVLLDIISRLPAKDAARTAALASRWRPLWRSATLAIVDSHMLPDGGASGPFIIGAPSPRVVTASVSRALAAHPGPFHFVHLTCSNMDEHRGEMASWINTLVAKGVQDLVFVNRPWSIDLCLPTTLFSCASLTRLCLGVFMLPDTAAVPHGARFPYLRELILCLNTMEERDLAFLLERSPVLEFLFIMGNQAGGVRLRLASHSLRCVQLGFSFSEDIDVNGASRIKIGRAPNLRVLGYLQPGGQELGISNTVIVAGNKENTAPSVQILAMVVQFGVRSAVKKVADFLRCFPNLETLHVHSPILSEEHTGKVNLKFWQDRRRMKVFFYEFRGSRSEVAFLKFIAERGRVLEQVVVVVAEECFSPGDDGMNAKLKPLTSAKWNNKSCKLQLFKSPFSGGGGPAYCHQIAADFGFADPFDLQYYYKAERIPVS